MTRYIFACLLLTAVYLLTLASLHPWDIAIGFGFSALIIFAVRMTWGGSSGGVIPLLSRIFWFFPFLFQVAKLMTIGTWNVALMVLHIRPVARLGVVAIPIGDRTPQGVAVTSLVDTLSPGSVLVDIDWEEGVMLFHILEDNEVDEVRDSYQRFYDRYQRRVFP